MASNTLRAFRPTGFDAIPGVVCFVLGLGGLLLLSTGLIDDFPRVTAADVGATVAIQAIQCLALVWRRVFARAALLAIAGAPILLALALPSPLFSLTALAVLFAVFLFASTPRRRVGTLLIAAVLVALGQAVNELRTGASFDGMLLATAALQAVVVIGVPLPFALMISAQREARRALGMERAALQREREALVQAAVSRERASMSRELHDIAAHHMAGIAVMASAMERQVDSDPAAARESARQVRAQSRTALDDLRQIVGLLRDDAEGNRSVETLAAVRELVGDRVAAGIAVQLRLVGSDDDALPGAGVGPLAQVVVFRMIQESLANAAIHAAGAEAVVELDDRSSHELVVTVTNGAGTDTRPTPDGGYGLIGMRERAELVGGRLHYGATTGGGWEVQLAVPKDAVSAVADEELS